MDRLLSENGRVGSGIHAHVDEPPRRLAATDSREIWNESDARIAILEITLLTEGAFRAAINQIGGPSRREKSRGARAARPPSQRA